MLRVLIIFVVFQLVGPPALAERFSDYPPMRTKDDAPINEDDELSRLENKLKDDKIASGNFARFKSLIQKVRTRNLVVDFKKDIDEMRSRFSEYAGLWRKEAPSADDISELAARVDKEDRRRSEANREWLRKRAEIGPQPERLTEKEKTLRRLMEHARNAR